MSGSDRGRRQPPGGGRGAGRPRGSGRPASDGAAGALPDARRVAVETLVRIDRDGAYANLVLPKVLTRSGLPERDRAFATELVYGTTRHRRSCDWFVDRFAMGDLDPTVRAALRLGTYQLRVLGTPPHAAVSATVDTVPRKARGLVNAVLRKVATAEDAWPSDAVRLSYPDWMVIRLTADLGADRAEAALTSMNNAASAVARDDGYVQDLASQWVAEAVGARSGERVLDLCAAPGGKATALAAAGANVVAADVRPGRVRLLAANAARLRVSGSASADGPAQPIDVASLAAASGQARGRATEAEPSLGLVLGEGADADADAARTEFHTPEQRQPGLSPRAGSVGSLRPVVADGLRPPFAAGSFDRVLVDAPCSGLGSLRRRADARWRIDADAPERLARLQVGLLTAAAPLVRSGGTLIYSVCTLTAEETTVVADAFTADHPGWAPSSAPVPGEAWEAWGTGALLLPQTADTDGMAVFTWTAPAGASPS